MMKFKDKLSDLMNEKEISSAEKLSKALNGDISPNAIRNYLKGIKPKSMYYYEILAEFFNVDTDFLYNDFNENRKVENKSIGEKLGLSDKSINNLKNVRNTNKNILIESDFFVDTIQFLDMISDLKTMLTHIDKYNTLEISNDEKIHNIEELQKLCMKFYSKFRDVHNSLDYFDSLGTLNILGEYKLQISTVGDGLDLTYMSTINTSIHSIEKSIKVIYSEMKDKFVYFIDSVN